jgi:riboflavin biosynthesis pyrimidine reductase
VAATVVGREAAIEPLIQDARLAGGENRRPGMARIAVLPPRLRDRYGSDLAIPLRVDRPTVIANFVTTLDGVVSYDTPEAHGGGEISGFFEPDRFVMGLLRSVADVVLIGAGTLRAGNREKWTPDHVHGPNAAAFAEIRASLGLAGQPTTAVVTASGELDLTHAGLSDPTIPVLLLTSERGAERLRREGVGAHVDIVPLGSDEADPRVALESLRSRGASVVLCEGGPHLIADFVGRQLIDELFLTVAPQIAGRSADAPRLSLLEGRAFRVADAPWARLVDLRRSGSHLFTRYTFEGASHGYR